MDTIKSMIVNSPALQPISYNSPLEVYVIISDGQRRKTLSSPFWFDHMQRTRGSVLTVQDWVIWSVPRTTLTQNIFIYIIGTFLEDSRPPFPHPYPGTNGGGPPPPGNGGNGRDRGNGGAGGAIASEPHFDIKIKTDTVPTWDGDDSLIGQWLINSNQRYSQQVKLSLRRTWVCN